MNMIPGSWQDVLVVAGIVCLIIGAVIAFRPRKRNRFVSPPKQSAQVFDFYAEKRARMIAHLGPRYLLARPINRRT